MSAAPKPVCWACHYAGYTCTKHPAEPAPDAVALRAALDEAEARDSFNARLEESKAREGLARIDADQQRARAEALERDRRIILDERDRTFALMLERAVKAEAERDALTAQINAANALLQRAQKIIDPCYPAASDSWQKDARAHLGAKP